jgi:hypothetical protein
MGAAWAFRHWPDAVKQPRGQAGCEDAGDDVLHEDKHILYRGPGQRLECRVCRKYAITAKGMRNMTRERCMGDIKALVHTSHQIRVTAGATWCTRCGAYTTRWPRRLAAACSGRPQTEAQRNVLRRLVMNLPPTTASYLGDVAAENGGLRDGSADHQAEIRWRHEQQARDGGGKATPPTGRYARLRGGALHRDTVQEEPAAAGHHIRHTSAVHEAKYSTSGSGQNSAHVDRACDPCAPRASDSWTRRVVASRHACARLCGACQAPTRTSCRGCGNALCTTCARSRAPCQPVAAQSNTS